MSKDAQDAARYRWLKVHARVVDEDGGWASHFEFPHLRCHNDSPNKKYQMKRRTLDQSIDVEILQTVEPNANL